MNRRIAALQIIEALRLHAGSNVGKFPVKLSDVTDYEIPAGAVSFVRVTVDPVVPGAVTDTSVTDDVIVAGTITFV